MHLLIPIVYELGRPVGMLQACFAGLISLSSTSAGT